MYPIPLLFATGVEGTMSIETLPQEDRVCVSYGSDHETVVLVHAPHLTRTSELWSNFLNEEEEDKEACFNGISSGDLVVVFEEGSVFSGETPYMETVVMHNILPSSTNPSTYIKCT